MMDRLGSGAASTPLSYRILTFRGGKVMPNADKQVSIFRSTEIHFPFSFRE